MKDFLKQHFVCSKQEVTRSQRASHQNKDLTRDRKLFFLTILRDLLGQVQNLKWLIKFSAQSAKLSLITVLKFGVG